MANVAARIRPQLQEWEAGVCGEQAKQSPLKEYVLPQSHRTIKIHSQAQVDMGSSACSSSAIWILGSSACSSSAIWSSLGALDWFWPWRL